MEIFLYAFTKIPTNDILCLCESLLKEVIRWVNRIVQD
jgi:hypothetical protein